MVNSRKKEPFLLFAGDVFFFFFSLWLMLFIRYRSLPSTELLLDHVTPFSFLFIVWVVVFFISGLYEKHTLILRDKIPSTILNAQLINCALAALFFYLIPYFGITPKTNLFIYLVLSFLFILLWRIHGETLLHVRNKQNAILIGSGEEMKELKREVNENPRYDLSFVSSIDLEGVESLDFKDEVLEQLYSKDVQVIVADFKNPKLGPILPNLYNLVFSRIRFVDMNKIYEDIFDRIPLSLVTYSWFLENIPSNSSGIYDFVKRVMDLILAFVGGIISLVFYPFIMLAIKMEDGGSFFIMQERVGKNNRHIRTYKFRTMTRNEVDLNKGSDNKVTRVGAFLRKSRLDELPQLWSVIYGDMSLIGPRPELPSGVKLYNEEIPFYNIRHIIKPGLSGWAQLYGQHSHHGVGVEQTYNKLSYDLYYIKNRSLMLDLKIALKTLKTLFSRSGI